MITVIALFERSLLFYHFVLYIGLLSKIGFCSSFLDVDYRYATIALYFTWYVLFVVYFVKLRINADPASFI